VTVTDDVRRQATAVDWTAEIVVETIWRNRTHAHTQTSALDMPRFVSATYHCARLRSCISQVVFLRIHSFLAHVDCSIDVEVLQRTGFGVRGTCRPLLPRYGWWRHQRSTTTTTTTTTTSK